MSLNNIKIQPQQLADLYSNALVETSAAPERKQQEAGTPSINLKFLGKNDKKILIIVSKDNVAYMEEGELTFLTNILAACKLSIADVAIINEKSFASPLSYNQLIEHFNSLKVILFDVAPSQIDLPFNFPYFQVQQFDQCTYLSAPALVQIEADKTMKSKLWNSLKTLFGL